jgi:serine/threonine-protein kinase
MGAVYEAVHEFTQRRVAVKLMHAGFKRSEIAAERFLREAQAPSSIGHPGIVEVLDGGYETDGSLYLVLELLEGETLTDLLRTGPISAEEIGGLTLQLLDALAAAHDAGFVHRDIKPDNIFLVGLSNEAPQVKLLDFGVAGVIAEPGDPRLTMAGAVLGTPLYMSPEQALGRRVDGRSDLWSVGAVIYQALAGKPPFRGESFQALVVSIATQEHLPLTVLRPDLPVRMLTVIERALQKDVDLRWQSAHEMADALEQALEHGRRRRGAGASDVDGRVSSAAQTIVEQRGVDTTLLPQRLMLTAMAVVLGVAGLVAWVVTHRHTEQAVPVPTVLAAARSDGSEGAALPPKEALAGGVAAKREGSSTLPRVANAAPLAPPVNANREASSPPPPPPQPSPTQPVEASPGRAAVNTLDSAAISRALQDHDRDLQRCYEDQVAADLMRPASANAPPPAPVRMDAEFEVDPAGAVQKLSLTGEASEALKRCVDATMTRWEFPRSAGTTEVRFPIVFQPNIVQR